MGKNNDFRQIGRITSDTLHLDKYTYQKQDPQGTETSQVFSCLKVLHKTMVKGQGI